MIVIGVSGKAQSGKDTFARHTGDYLAGKGYEVHYVTFAAKLKMAASLIFDIPLSVMHSQEGKQAYLPQFGLTVREILQRLGTEVGRSIYKPIWVWHTLNRIRQLIDDQADVVFVTDVRFANEYEALRGIKARLVHLERPEHLIPFKSHASETGLDDPDLKWDYQFSCAKLSDVHAAALAFVQEMDMLLGAMKVDRQKYAGDIDYYIRYGLNAEPPTKEGRTALSRAS